ncbi:MAG: TetR/AcrR family transcriptional regulator [Firmicutes bacterium]|nr:TetR/AcrR family transcriptional regulator [Bacillota bacterium]
MIDENNGKREHILNIAAELFNRYGYKKTSMEQIARAARVGKASIYQLFNDKALLLGEVYQLKAQKLREKMIDSYDATETVVTRLLKMLAIAREYCSNDPLFCQFLELRELEELKTLPQFSAIESGAVKLIKELLDEGVARGEIRSMPSEMAARILFRIGFYLSHHGADLFELYPPAEILGLFDTVLQKGLSIV